MGLNIFLIGRKAARTISTAAIIVDTTKPAFPIFNLDGLNLYELEADNLTFNCF